MSQITNEVKNQIKKRRTFAIISHPDAGKTTLTEKFLLYGGAINQAGSVKGKATAKHAVSDWMEIEKERGISVTSSVLQFNYDGYCINILDTPGHQDFLMILKMNLESPHVRSTGQSVPVKNSREYMTEHLKKLRSFPIRKKEQLRER